MPELHEPIKHPLRDMYEKLEPDIKFSRTPPTDNPVPDVQYDEDGIPKLPPDLTAITSQELGRIFQAVEAWDDYLRALMTAADREVAKTKSVLKLIKSFLAKEYRDEKNMPKADIADAIELDYRYVEANTRYLKAKFTFEELEMAKHAVSRKYSLISREITRRSSYEPRDPDRRKPAENRFGNRRL